MTADQRLDQPEARGAREVEVDVARKTVREENLLREAEREEQQPGAHTLGVEAVLDDELRLQDAVADDRPGDQMREERDEERVPQQVALRAERAAVHVDHVRDPFEGVEADPDRQHDRVDEVLQAREVALRDHVHEVERVAARECRVLEVAEQREHADDADGEDRPPVRLPALVIEQETGGERDRRRARHQQREPPVGVCIEVIRRADDEEQAQAVLRDEEVREPDRRQEEQQEGKAVEEHEGCRTLGWSGG